MKYPICHQIALFTACTFLPAAGLLAQSPAAPAAAAPATTPSVSEPAAATTTTTATEEEHEGGRMHALSKLTPEERGKLKAAHQAALQDPAVKAAEAQKNNGREGKRAYHEAVHTAMLKADPSVQPILDKMREDRPHKKDF